MEDNRAEVPTVWVGTTPAGLTAPPPPQPPRFFRGRMPFLSPNQQRRSTEGMCVALSVVDNLFCVIWLHSRCAKHVLLVGKIVSKVTYKVPSRHQTLVQLLFLSPDAVRWRGICYGDVAVCVSVMLMYCAKTTESSIVRPLPDCSPAILDFPYQIGT